MRKSENAAFFELLTLTPPDVLLPVLEKGLEIQKLELLINPDSQDIQRSINYSSAILAFLRLNRIGRGL